MKATECESGFQAPWLETFQPCLDHANFTVLPFTTYHGNAWGKVYFSPSFLEWTDWMQRRSSCRLGNETTARCPVYQGSNHTPHWACDSQQWETEGSFLSNGKNCELFQVSVLGLKLQNRRKSTYQPWMIWIIITCHKGWLFVLKKAKARHDQDLRSWWYFLEIKERV